MGRTKGTTARRTTLKGVNRGFRNKYDRLHTQYTGYHSKLIQYRAPRTYRHERKTQFLVHFATTLKEWYSSFPNQSEIEVQIAMVTSAGLDEPRYFISSNSNKTAEVLYSKFCTYAANEFKKQEKPEDLPNLLRQMSERVSKQAEGSKAPDRFRRSRHAKKFHQELSGVRTIPEEVILKGYGKNASITINASEDVGATVRDFVQGPSGKKIAIVTSKEGMHAEQKILLALCKAFTTNPTGVSAIFAGTFRPCRGCFESLNLVQKYLLPDLVFGSRPGHFWQTTTCAHQKIRNLLIAGGKITPEQRMSDFDEHGLLLGLTDTTYRPDLRVRDDDEEEGLHYMSDSDSEVED